MSWCWLCLEHCQRTVRNSSWCWACNLDLGFRIVSLSPAGAVDRLKHHSMVSGSCCKHAVYSWRPYEHSMTALFLCRQVLLALLHLRARAQQLQQHHRWRAAPGARRGAPLVPTCSCPRRPAHPPRPPVLSLPQYRRWRAPPAASSRTGRPCSRSRGSPCLLRSCWIGACSATPAMRHP